MNKTVVAAVAAILVGMNVYTLYKFRSYRHDATTMLQANKSAIDERGTLSMQMPLNYSNIGTSIADVVACDTAGNNMRLGDVLRHRTLVCRISDTYCSSCNNYLVDVFRTLKEPDNERIIFLASCEQRRFYRKYVSQFGIEKFQVYFVEEDMLNADEIGFPYFFVAAADGRIELCYIPAETTPQLDVQNLSQMYNMMINAMK